MKISPFEVTFRSLSELPISFVSLCILRLSFCWLLHDQQYPLIGFHTSMGYITRFYWRHLAFGFAFYDLPEHWFIELHGGQDLSFVILIIDPCYSSWRINLCNINLTPCLNVWLARTWFWVLNCMSDVWTLWCNTRTHWYTHWTFLYRLCDWISLNLQCINFGLASYLYSLNLWFHKI